MGLYLTIFDGDEEIDGVEIGAYADFGRFREAVTKHVEGGMLGSRCPVLILHPDCDGQWTPSQASSLERELAIIAERFRALPPERITDGWQPGVANAFGLRQDNLFDCFFDVDGEPLIERLIALARLSQARNLPILFQ